MKQLPMINANVEVHFREAKNQKLINSEKSLTSNVFFYADCKMVFLGKLLYLEGRNLHWFNFNIYLPPVVVSVLTRTAS